MRARTRRDLESWTQKLIGRRQDARAPTGTLAVPDHARTGTLAVRSSLPQLTQAPLMARKIAFQTQ
jgi:hypothetical protein